METNRLVTIGALSERTEVKSRPSGTTNASVLICRSLPAARAGDRLYCPEEYQRRLVFVRRARELGFSLEDVRALLCGITENHMLTSIGRSMN